MEQRRRDLGVYREPSSALTWTGERLDMRSRGSLSRVMRSALYQQLRLRSSGRLLVSTALFARVFNMDDFWWAIGKPNSRLLGRAMLVAGCLPRRRGCPHSRRWLPNSCCSCCR